MIIDLESVYVETEHVAVVRASGLDDEQTVIFTVGQSAIDSGFLIDLPCEEVIERLQTVQHHELAKRLLEKMESGETEQSTVES